VIEGKRLRGRPGRWPILPIAPLIVAVIGIATAVTIALVAANQLQRTSDEASALRSKALAAALAARVRASPADRRPALLARASKRTGASFLLVDISGNVLVDQSLAGLPRLEVMSLLQKAEGLTEVTAGRVRYAASSVSPPMEHLSVMAFVEAPSPAVGTARMGNAIAVLTMLLLSVAISVSLLFTRTARDDVTYVRQRIADMARGGVDAHAGVAGAGLVPLRSLDQVGLLTAELNQLIHRFAEGERGYRDDLKAAALLDAERSQFLAGLSHELRTPLNAILGFTHLLESEEEGPLSYDAKEALAMISSSGEHLKALIDDILDLSAMETGQLRLSRMAIDTYTIAEEVTREAQVQAKGRPITITVGGVRGAYAWADPRRVRQVLANLVSNSLKATVEGEVRVTVSREGDQVVVKVADSGRGIEREALPTIFEPYKQAGDVSLRRKGAGLGLAISRRLVLLHGGSITAQSELGRGSLFTVTFPDETHSTHVPRDSLVPWADAPGVLSGKRVVSSPDE
jgi:signal transduction histidine kinase